ncbi:MAG: hypothetical protein IJT51_10690 [Bacteroidales bacterium]|nr:hypothetical protein [Bacteroidales bacterium]
MSEEKFMNKYRIASTRAQWHDYNGGKYFVTICTHGRKHYFGEISGGQMNLSEIGKYTNTVIQTTSTHNHYAEIPLYVIMPNHLHLIVVIDDDTIGGIVVDINNGDFVETVHAPSLQRRKQRWKNDIVDNKMQMVSHRKNKLSVVVGGIKFAVTKFAHENGIPFAWQTRFHDHIIRDTNEMNRIAKYIENNVAKWEYKHIN